MIAWIPIKLFLCPDKIENLIGAHKSVQAGQVLAASALIGVPELDLLKTGRCSRLRSFADGRS